MFIFWHLLQQSSHYAPNKSHGPLPQESEFVTAARNSIPTAQMTTAMARGRGVTGRGRGNIVENATSSRRKGRGRGSTLATATGEVSAS
jgi:hypothetical protein